MLADRALEHCTVLQTLVGSQRISPSTLVSAVRHTERFGHIIFIKLQDGDAVGNLLPIYVGESALFTPRVTIADSTMSVKPDLF